MVGHAGDMIVGFVTMITIPSSGKRGRLIRAQRLSMPKQFQLKMKRNGHADTVVIGELTDEEHETVARYLENYDRLIESKPLREGIPCSISINYTEEEGVEVSATLPDSDTLSILLHRLRPFILQNEPASFATAIAIVGKRLDNVQIRQLLSEQRQLYDGRKSQRLMTLTSNDVIVNSEKVLYDWLNAHEYHSDPDKREVVDAIFERMPNDLVRGILISMLVDKTLAVQNLASIIAFLLGKSSSLNFQAKGT
jgi:hypothetical protein